jgi:hypothetical protein
MEAHAAHYGKAGGMKDSDNDPLIIDALCKVCGEFKTMTYIDSEIGWTCDDCIEAVEWAAKQLSLTYGVRKPQKGDMIPVDEDIPW